MVLRLNIIGCALVALLLTACYGETYDVNEMSIERGKTQVILTFVTSNNSSTRSAVEDPDGYEAGVEWEDYVDISGQDYKIYFFTYNSSNKDAGTLIAELTPTDIQTIETNDYTSYMVTGEVPATLMGENSFRVVMLTNWGAYPSTTIGVTTIDDLVEGDNTTFSAEKKFFIDAENHIPFYGVQEYTGITFATGTTTTLTTPVSLLRAVAKVEVILTDESNYEAFENVEIVKYNSQGYCAPAGVYTAEDYDTQMKNNPSSGNWSDEWVSSLHLLNNANDTGSKTQAFTHISGTSQDTWRIYVPEYDNTGNDFSYIRVTIDGTPYEIYFAEYDEDGFTDNSNTSNRYNLKRNNLYRYYITIINEDREEKEVTITLRVWVDKWEYCFDNEYIFGTDDN